MGVVLAGGRGRLEPGRGGGGGIDVVEAVGGVIIFDDDDEDVEEDSTEANTADDDDDDDDVSALGSAVRRVNNAIGRVNIKISGLFRGPTKATWRWSVHGVISRERVRDD